MKQKVLLLVLVLLVCLFVMTGCNLRLTLTTVNVVKVYSDSSHSKDAVMEIFETYNKTTGKQKNISIELVVPGQLKKTNRMAQLLAAGDGPDFSKVETQAIIDGGYAAYLNDLPGMQEFVEEYCKKNSKNYKGNKVYSLPTDVVCLGFIYNKDIFERAGIVDENGKADPPDTYTEVRDYAKRITSLDNKTYGIALPFAWSNWYTTDVENGSLSEIGFGKFNPQSGRFEFDGYKPVWEMYMGIKEDKSYFPGVDTLDNDTARIQFAEGRIGMKYAGSWDAGVLTGQYPAKCRWGVAPLPTSKTGGPGMYQYTSNTNGFVMTTKGLEKHGEDVMAEVAKFLYSDEYMKFMYQKEKALPINLEIVSDVDKSTLSDGWNDFVNLIKLGTVPNSEPNVSLVDGNSSSNIFKQKVWTQEMSVDEGIEFLNTVYNDALDKAVDNGEINLNKYINKNYSRKLPERLAVE